LRAAYAAIPADIENQGVRTMYAYYIAEYAYGNSAGPFNNFTMELEWWGGQNGQLRCNESVWIVPGTVQS